MKYKNLIIEPITVTGRGLLFKIDLVESGIVADKWIEEIPIKIDDIIVYEGKEFLVRGVEVAGRLTDGPRRTSSLIALVVREIL
ncbi:hypothetical protein [Emticicia fontis]